MRENREICAENLQMIYADTSPSRRWVIVATPQVWGLHSDFRQIVVQYEKGGELTNSTSASWSQLITTQ